MPLKWKLFFRLQAMDATPNTLLIPDCLIAASEGHVDSSRTCLQLH